MRGRRSSLNNSSVGTPVPVEPTMALAPAAMSQMIAPMAKVRRSWERLQRFKVNFSRFGARLNQQSNKCADAWAVGRRIAKTLRRKDAESRELALEFLCVSASLRLRGELLAGN